MSNVLEPERGPEDRNSGERPKSTLVSRNVMIGRRRTSVRLEPEMWVALFDISVREDKSIHDICGYVDRVRKPETSLTAAIRVFVMSYYRAAATEEGHREAGHGVKRSSDAGDGNAVAADADAEADADDLAAANPQRQVA